MPRRSGEGSLCQSSHGFGRQDRRQLGRCHRVVPASAGAHAILEAGNQAGQLGEPAQSAGARELGRPCGSGPNQPQGPARFCGILSGKASERDLCEKSAQDYGAGLKEAYTALRRDLVRYLRFYNLERA